MDTLEDAYPQLVPFFIQMSHAFDAHMSANPQLILQDTNPAPPISGFDQVPEHFRPVVYKLLQRSLDPKHLTLDTVLQPHFGMVHEQPQLVHLQGQIQAMQTDIASLKATQMHIQADITYLRAGINVLLHNAGLPLV